MKNKTSKRHKTKKLVPQVSNFYKENAFRASLIASQQNSLSFHVCTTAFCSIAKHQPPQPLNLPTMSEIPNESVTSIPSEPLKSAGCQTTSAEIGTSEAEKASQSKFYDDFKDQPISKNAVREEVAATWIPCFSRIGLLKFSNAIFKLFDAVMRLILARKLFPISLNVALWLENACCAPVQRCRSLCPFFPHFISINPFFVLV